MVGVVLRISIVLYATASKGGHYSFLRQYRVNPLRGGREAASMGSRFTSSPDTDSSEFRDSISLASPGSHHTSLFQLSRSSFSIKALTLK